jgi:NAD(P)-dependent dehydrogenase (short-subunit alcohol dehydrogenase family)
MKVIIVGATGTIGSAVAAALAGRHQVVRASRRGETPVDIEDVASIRALFDAVPDADAVVCCAGTGAYKPLEQLTDDDFAASLRSKLMGQVNLARLARERVRAGGSVTLTSGILSREPSPGSAALSLVNAGLEAFVRAAALEMPRGLRINAVCPPWVKETLRALGRDDASGVSAATLAKAYAGVIEGTQQGAVVVVPPGG